MPKKRPPKVLCFGEILWDFLPTGLFPGGAPFNVAYHLSRHAIDVRLVSGIGRDLLGDELIRRLDHWGIGTDLLTFHQGLPTGYVRAELGAAGDAHYDIIQSVAWDQILASTDVVQQAVEAQGLVFGSLAQRTAFNQNALKRLFAVLPEDAWRIFDVNLRPPHDNVPLVRELASESTILKLNAAEAARIAADEEEAVGREEDDARALAETHGCKIVCVTAGARGAGLLHKGKWHWEKGKKVKVADTVGSGDAFLAALVSGFLKKSGSDEEILERACRLGEWIATQRGATPDYETTPG
jgi:fructokinase